MTDTLVERIDSIILYIDRMDGRSLYCARQGLTAMKEDARSLEAAQKRIAELEGVLKPFSNAHLFSQELNRLKPGARSRPHDMVITDEFVAARKALEGK